MKKVVLFIIIFFCFISNIRALDKELYSKYVVMYNLNEDMIIEEVNKDDKIAIASLTKIMTTYVAIKNIEDINQTVVLNNDVFTGLSKANASVAGFRVGQTVTYEDLLYGIMLPSGADAANAVAINISGNTDNFVKLMNDEVKMLGLKNTHFANITGLDNESHYSSVNDVAIMLKMALKNDLFKKIFTSKKYITSDKSMTIYSTMFSGLDRYNIKAEYILGGKTGFTDAAGRCLASIAYDNTNKINYLLVTAMAPNTDRSLYFLDAKNIYEYYFNNYKYHTIVAKNDEIITLDTKYAKENKVTIVANKDINKYLNNSFDKSKVNIEYQGIKTITYDTKNGSRVGSATVLYEGEELAKFNVFLNHTLHFSMLNYIKTNIIYIMLTILLVITVFMAVIKRNKRRRKYE